MSPHYLTVKDVADRLQVSTGTVYRMISYRHLRASRISSAARGSLRVSEDALREFVDSRETQPVASTRRNTQRDRRVSR